MMFMQLLLHAISFIICRESTYFHTVRDKKTYDIDDQEVIIKYEEKEEFRVLKKPETCVFKINDITLFGEIKRISDDFSKHENFDQEFFNKFIEKTYEIFALREFTQYLPVYFAHVFHSTSFLTSLESAGNEKYKSRGILQLTTKGNYQNYQKVYEKYKDKLKLKNHFSRKAIDYVQIPSALLERNSTNIILSALYFIIYHVKPVEEKISAKNNKIPNVRNYIYNEILNSLNPEEVRVSTKDGDLKLQRRLDIFKTVESAFINYEYRNFRMVELIEVTTKRSFKGKN